MNKASIHIKNFDYHLPDDKIAKYPLELRSSSKLLFYNKGEIKHQLFNDLPNLLPERSMLVFNNTKVIEARLIFTKDTGAEIEVFLVNPRQQENATVTLEQKGSSSWKCMIGNKKRWKEGDILSLSGSQSTLIAKWEDRENDLVSFEYPAHKSFKEMIEELGRLPIPPYLNRPTEEIDLTRYQTQFAQLHGSVAAPTAALHFDAEMYQALEKKYIKCKYLTLHVGAGTFKPVSVDDAMDHVMHEEYIIYTKELIESLIAHDGPIIAVGTTSLRSLESLYWFGVGLITGELSNFQINQYFPYHQQENVIPVKDALNKIIDWMNVNGLKTIEGTSSIYIVPGYLPKMVKGIITNFHQPQSTLLLLISALIGNDWKKIYASALENNYRFLSYGDSSLLLF